MKLLIDIGNTSAKLAIADAASMDILHYERLHESWEDAIVRLVEDYKVEAIRLSTVAGRDSRLQAVLESIALPAIWLTVDYPCPVRPFSGVPRTYGVDRYAADIGAMVQDPEHTLLVVDAGTCITYDLISVQGELLGGAISPGVQLRLNAMHEHTAQLPLIEVGSRRLKSEGLAGLIGEGRGMPSGLLGHDTASYMLSAAINGAQFEIEGYIRRLLRAYPDLHVFCTGGNSYTLSEDIHCPVTFESHLIFRGLAAI